MAELSDADQSGLSLPRFDSRRSDRAGPGDFPGPGAARRLPRHSGMAQFLLQVTDDQRRALPRARPVHSIHEAEKYAALDDGRRPDHPPGPGILRLNRAAWPLGACGRTRLGTMAFMATATPNASAISSLLARAFSAVSVCTTIEPSQPAKSAAVLFRPGVRGLGVRTVEYQVPGLLSQTSYSPEEFTLDFSSSTLRARSPCQC